MKKMISFLLALLLVSSCFAFRLPDANALGAVWVKEFYKDKFGDTTDEYYLTNKSQFKGTYNSDSVSNGKLGANLIFERDGENLLAFITLFIKGKDQVKNGTSSEDSYDISVKRSDGSQFSTSGVMLAGRDRIEIGNSIDISNSILAGDIDIYVENLQKPNINYVFKVKSSNYKDIYNQEIVIPYQNEEYARAETYFASERYDEAIEVFARLGNYRDAAKRVVEVTETKNESLYLKAEALLAAGDYGAAAEAFKALGGFRDSADRADEAIEAKNAEPYPVYTYLI